MKPSKFIWMNGTMVPWADATVHVMAHGLHYGTSVFEGIRCYDTPQGRAIFRLGPHIKRLIESARIYRLNFDSNQSEIEQACKDIILQNDLSSGYIRPLIYLGLGGLAIIPPADQKADVMVGAFEWGAYLGDDGIKNGIAACVSSWQRPNSGSFPILAKAGGHYLNSLLIASEAARNGYQEGITVTATGMIGEGSGENFFLVRDGRLYTPPLSAGILAGITRDAVVTIARDLDIELVEQMLPRDLLYTCDEIFLTGTAAEITPVKSVDRIPVGTGKRGPVTKQIQDRFFGLFNGSTDDQHGWLDFVGK